MRSTFAVLIWTAAANFGAQEGDITLLDDLKLPSTSLCTAGCFTMAGKCIAVSLDLCLPFQRGKLHSCGSPSTPVKSHAGFVYEAGSEYKLPPLSESERATTRWRQLARSVAGCFRMRAKCVAMALDLCLPFQRGDLQACSSCPSTPEIGRGHEHAHAVDWR